MAVTGERARTRFSTSLRLSLCCRCRCTVRSFRGMIRVGETPTDHRGANFVWTPRRRRRQCQPLAKSLRRSTSCYPFVRCPFSLHRLKGSILSQTPPAAQPVQKPVESQTRWQSCNADVKVEPAKRSAPCCSVELLLNNTNAMQMGICAVDHVFCNNGR